MKANQAFHLVPHHPGGIAQQDLGKQDQSDQAQSPEYDHRSGPAQGLPEVESVGVDQEITQHAAQGECMGPVGGLGA